MQDLTQQIKTVLELDDFELTNTYLEMGWVLLGVHQHMRKQVGMIRSKTAYILGHTSPNPPHPGVVTSFDFMEDED
jgi:hypothetical protein